MKLTRRVLVEKKSKFWNYTTLYDVPDWLWKKTSYELNQEIRNGRKIQDDSQISNINEAHRKHMNMIIINYLVSTIVSPLLNRVDYEINYIRERGHYLEEGSPDGFFPPYYEINFTSRAHYGVKFKIEFDLLTETVEHLTNFIRLKYHTEDIFNSITL